MRPRKFRWSDTLKQVVTVYIALSMFGTGHPEVFWAITVHQVSSLSLYAGRPTSFLANSTHIPAQDSPHSQSGRKILSRPLSDPPFILFILLAHVQGLFDPLSFVGHHLLSKLTFSFDSSRQQQ
jgi:hypothetical protein